MPVFVRFPITKVSSLLMAILILALWGVPLTEAKVIDGVGKLKFGMSPSEVEALEGCSSDTECLYDILGKNRYFTLIYGANGAKGSKGSLPSSQAQLTHIDIDMGNHTREWFAELFAVMEAQFPISHLPTEHEAELFETGTSNELIIGFSNGSILLKIVRRPFGNLILRVIYQDSAASEALRQHWEQNRPEPAPQ